MMIDEAKIEMLIFGDIPLIEIERATGVSRSSIHYWRTRKRDWRQMSILTAEKLLNYFE